MYGRKYVVCKQKEWTLRCLENICSGSSPLLRYGLEPSASLNYGEEIENCTITQTFNTSTFIHYNVIETERYGDIGFITQASMYRTQLCNTYLTVRNDK